MTYQLQKTLIKYDLPKEVLTELVEKEQEGWKFVISEENLTHLGRQTGLVDVALQCALGRRDMIMLGEVNTTIRATSERVTLALYFVDEGQYQLMLHVKKHREREREFKNRVRGYIPQ